MEKEILKKRHEDFSSQEKKILKKILGLHAHHAHIKNPDLMNEIIKIIKGYIKNGN